MLSPRNYVKFVKKQLPKKNGKVKTFAKLHSLRDAYHLKRILNWNK